MKQMCFGGVFIACLSGLSLLVCALECRGEDRRYVEVLGRATVTARPDVARINAELVATDESSKKALEAFLEKKGKFNTAVNPMKFEGIKVEFDRTRFSPPPTYDQAMMEPFAGGEIAEIEESANEMNVVETATIEIPGLEKLEEDQVKRLVAKIYDEIKSNGGEPIGAQMNPFGYVSGEQQSDIKYFISKPQSLVQKGQKEAMEDARAKANHFAKLSGGKLGRVISVKEIAAEMGDDDQSMQQAMMEIYGMIGSQDAFSSDTFGDIKFEVKLKVQFELED